MAALCRYWMERNGEAKAPHRMTERERGAQKKKYEKE